MGMLALVGYDTAIDCVMGLIHCVLGQALAEELWTNGTKIERENTRLLWFIHTLRVHYEHAAVNLN